MSPRGLLALLLLGVLVLVFAVLAVALVELRSYGCPGTGTGASRSEA